MSGQSGPATADGAPRRWFCALTDHRALLLLIFLAALTLRLAYLAEIRDTPFYSGLVGDEVSYDRWARKIASGEIIGRQVFYQEPAYPYSLALVYRLIGGGPPCAYFFQALLSAFAVFFIFGIANRTFNDRRIGLVAAALWAGYKVDYFFVGQILKASIGVSLVSAALWLTLVARDRKRPAWTAAAGLCWGLLLLIGGNFYFAGPLVMVWLVMEIRELPRKKSALLAGAWLFGFGLLPGLCATRNWLVCDRLVITTAQGGTNFYLANFKGNPWGTSANPSFSHRVPGREFNEFRAEAERREGRTFREDEVSNYWFSQAWREIGEDPGLAALRVLRKFLILTSRHELTPNLSYDFFRQHYSLLLRLPLPAFWLAGPFGFAGLALALRRRRAGLPAVFVAGYGLSLLIFYSYGRFRHPLIPALLVFAAYLIVEMARATGRREYRLLAVNLAVAAALSALAFPQWRETPEDLSWNKVCFIYHQQGDYLRAIDACGRALEQNPALTGARVRRALSLQARGRLAEAAAECREGIRLDPDDPRLHRRLAGILSAKGDQAGATVELEIATRMDPAAHPADAGEISPPQ